MHSPRRTRKVHVAYRIYAAEHPANALPALQRAASAHPFSTQFAAHKSCFASGVLNLSSVTEDIRHAEPGLARGTFQRRTEGDLRRGKAADEGAAEACEEGHVH